MKINKVILTSISILSLLTSCKFYYNPCYVGDIYIYSYTINKIEHSYNSNLLYYDLYNAFDPEGIKLIFNEDKTANLTIFNNTYNGSYIYYESSTGKGSDFTITFNDSDNSIATGNIYHGCFDGCWTNCTLYFKNETYAFKHNEDIDHYYDKVEYYKSMTKVYIINACIHGDHHIISPENIEYTYGEVIKDNSNNTNYYFRDDNGNLYPLNLNNGYYYDFINNNISSSYTSLKEGYAIYKGNLEEDSWFALFNLIDEPYLE